MSKQRNNLSGTAKDRVSHSIKLTLIKTTQRLKYNRKNKIGNSFEQIDNLTEIVKRQHSSFQQVAKAWNKYEEKAGEAALASRQFEESIMISCGIKKIQSILGIVKDHDVAKPMDNFDDMKKRLEFFIKELKDVDNLRQNYFAYEQLHEKATDPRKKENEKQLLEKTRTDIMKKIEELERIIPKEIQENETRMRGYMVQYYKKKNDSLTEIIESTHMIIDQLQAIQDESYSSPRSIAKNRNSINQSDSPLRPSNTSSDDTKTSAGNCATLSDPISNGTQNKPNCSTLVNTMLDSKSDLDFESMPKPFDVVATFAYKADEQDELEFDAGDQITVEEWPSPEDEEPGWLYGCHIKTGKQGLFPANHVKLLHDVR